MRSVVALLDLFTSHSTWLKPLALAFHSHPTHGHAQRSLSVFSPSLSTSCRSSASSSLSSWPTVTPWQSTTCATPRTGPSSPWTITSPSQVMSPTPWSSPTPRSSTTRSPATSSIFQDSLAYTVPFVRPLHGCRHARQATRRSTPRLRRLPPSGRCKCQSVVERGNLWKGAIAIILVLVSETWKVLKISFL